MRISVRLAWPKHDTINDTVCVLVIRIFLRGEKPYFPSPRSPLQYLHDWLLTSPLMLMGMSGYVQATHLIGELHTINISHIEKKNNNDLIPPAFANIIVHLAAMNTGFRSDIGLAVMIFPPIDLTVKGNKTIIYSKLGECCFNIQVLGIGTWISFSIESRSQDPIEIPEGPYRGLDRDL